MFDVNNAFILYCRHYWKDWEEVKVGLKSVNESCRIDLSEMMKALRVSQPETAMDNARRGTNRGGKVVGYN